MVQEVSVTSWGSRIIGAFFGILIGLALFLGAFFLVFWNEGHGLHTEQALEQTQKVLISIPNTPIDPNNNMKVVYFSGLATTQNIVTDKLLNISENAIQLHRHVEMYQWKQNTETNNEKQWGGSEKEVKTYTYEKIWAKNLIYSSEFKEQTGHQNPNVMPINQNIQYANKVTVGDFSLPAKLSYEITGSKPVDLTKANILGLQSRLDKPVHLTPERDVIYVGNDEQTPNIGDLRVNVTAVYPQDVSIIAQQTGHTLQSYMTPVGHAIILIEMGQVSPEEMIHKAEVANSVVTWLLRLLSLVMMIMGLSLIMKPFSVLADAIPFIGSLVGFGTFLIAFILGLAFWLIAVSIAWFAVRPLLAVGLIIISALCCYGIYAKAKNYLQ